MRIFTIAVTAIVVVILVAALKGGAFRGKVPSPAAMTDQVLRVGDQKGAGRALLEAAGELKDVPYRIEWAQFQAGSALIEAINADAIDIAATGDASTIFALSSGAPIKVIGGINSNPGTNAIVAMPGSSAHSLRDLRGKSVATVRGSMGHLLLLAALRHENMPFDAVKIVFLPPSDAKAALSGGSVDAWSIWEPFLGLAELTDHVATIADGGGLFNAHGFQITSAHAIEAKRALLRDYIVRLTRAYAWANANIDAYAEVFSRETGMPRDVARRFVERVQMKSVPVDDGFVRDEQAVSKLFADAKVTPFEVDISQAVDRSFPLNGAATRP